MKEKIIRSAGLVFGCLIAIGVISYMLEDVDYPEHFLEVIITSIIFVMIGGLVHVLIREKRRE